MKTKIKRHSRSVISVLLAVCMLISCMTVGLIATDAAKVSKDERVGAITDIQIRGSFNSWSPTANHSGSGTFPYTATILLSAATHEFKVFFEEGGSQACGLAGSDSTYTVGSGDKELAWNSGSNISLAISTAGYYDFTVSTKNNKNWISVSKSKHNVVIDDSITHGTVTASSATPKWGDTVTLTPKPDSGYQLGSYTVTKAGGGTVTVTNNQFTMPDENVTVSATFTENTSTLLYLNGRLCLNGTYIGGEKGSWKTKDETFQVTRTGAFTYSIDLNTTFTNLSATGSDGYNGGDPYFFLYDKTNDCYLGPNSSDNVTLTTTSGSTSLKKTASHDKSFKFNLTSNQKPTLIFDLSTMTMSWTSEYDVSITAGSNGGISVSPSTLTNLTGSNTFTVTATPAAGYHVVWPEDFEPTETTNVATVTVDSAKTYTVGFVKDQYTLTAEDAEHGSFSLSPSTSPNDWGTSITVTDIVPNQGYELDEVSYNDGTKHVLSTAPYTFELPKANTSVTVTFKEIMHTGVSVAAKGSADGSTFDTTLSIPATDLYISASGTTSATVGEVTGVSISAPATFTSGSDTYSFYQWSVTGGTLGSAASTRANTVTASANDATVTAQYKKNYTVTAIAGEHGSVDVDSATVPAGGTATFTFTPDTDYCVSAIKLNGGANVLPAGSIDAYPYTTPAITADTTVAAEFYPTVLARAEVNTKRRDGTTERVGAGTGTVRVNSKTADASSSEETVAKNSTVTFTAAADEDSAFCGWYNSNTSAKLLSTNPTLTMTVDAATTVYAVFTKANFYLCGEFYQAHLAKQITHNNNGTNTNYKFTKSVADPSKYTYNDDFMFASFSGVSQDHRQFVNVGFGDSGNNAFSTASAHATSGISSSGLAANNDCYKWTCGVTTTNEGDLNNCYKNVTFTWDAINESLSWTTKDIDMDKYTAMYVYCDENIWDHLWLQGGEELTHTGTDDIELTGVPYIDVPEEHVYNIVLVKNSVIGDKELKCKLNKDNDHWTNDIGGMYAGGSYKIEAATSGADGTVTPEYYGGATPPTYYLTGAYSDNTPRQIFGTAWDPDAVALEYNAANGKYEKTFSGLNATDAMTDRGTILFKVNKNGDMTTSWPARNQSVRVKSYTTDIKFSFNPGTHEITVTQSPEGGSWLYSGTAAADRVPVDVTNGWSAFTASESTTYGKTKFMYGTTDTGLSNALAPSYIYEGTDSIGYWADITSTITHGTNYFFGLCAYSNKGNLIGNKSEQINHTTKSAGTTVEIKDSNNNVLFKIQPKQNNDVSNNAHYMLVFDIDWTRVDGIGVKAWDHTKSTNGNAGNGSYVDYQFFYKPKLTDNTSDETPAAVKTVDIFAKNGTLRDTTFNRFTNLANTEILDYFYYEETNPSTGVTTVYESIEAYNAAHSTKQIAITHDLAYGNSTYDKILNVPVGAKIKLRTYLSGNDSAAQIFQTGKSFADTHYLKAYCINGMTYAVHSPSEATTVAEDATVEDGYDPKANDQYYEEIWTVRDVNTTYTKNDGTIDNATKEGKTIEITPIYYMKDNSNCKTFYIDGYDGEVHNAWGNMLCVYPYYEGKSNLENAFGGYPGQPMLFWGGKYQMEIPLTVDGTASGASVKGLTLHNAYWDLFHRNEVDLRCKARNHAQTYDYDDFYKLYKEKNPDTIIFDFKYRTKEDHYNDGYQYENRTFTDGTAKAASDFVGTEKNGVELVTDYFGRQVDVFGNLINDANQSDYDASHPQDKELLIVSTGYKDTYVGEYATLWAVYAPQTEMDGTTAKAEPGKFIGYISSSMLYLNNWDRRLQYTDGDSTAAGRMSWSEFKDTYELLKKSYTGVPALISYEKEIWNDSKDKANRSDGKWYYSNKSDKVRSTIKIQYGAEALLSSPDKSILSEAWREDEFDSEKIGVGGVNNIGTITGCSAYFTNTSPNLNGKVDSGEQFADNKKNFDFRAVPSGSYMFAYWVRYSNGKYYQVSEDEVAQSPMSSNDVYIARFVEARTGSLTIEHAVEQTNTFNGTGTPSLTVTVKNGDTVIETFTGTKVDISKWIDSHFNSYKIYISLSTDPTDSDESFMKEIVSSSADYAPDSATWNANYTSAYSMGADTGTKTVTIDEFTVESVLNSGVASLRYVSHLMKPIYTYNYEIKYTYTSRFYGEQSFTQTGVASEEDYTGLKTGAVLNTDFIINKTPFEKNFRKEINWNYTNNQVGVADPMENNAAAATEEANTYKMTAHVYSSNTVNDRVSAEFILPYDYLGQESDYAIKKTDVYDNNVHTEGDTDNLYDTSHETVKLETQAYKLFTADGVAHDGGDDVQASTLRLLEAPEYLITDDTTGEKPLQYHYKLYDDVRYYTGNSFKVGGTTYYLNEEDIPEGADRTTHKVLGASDSVTFRKAKYQPNGQETTYHYAVADTSGIPGETSGTVGPGDYGYKIYFFSYVRNDETGAYLDNAGKPLPEGQSPIFNGQYCVYSVKREIDGIVKGTGVKKYFTRWDISNTKGEFVASCYNRRFNFSGFDNYVVRPIFASDSANNYASSTNTKTTAAITYLGDTRNQWNNGDKGDYDIFVYGERKNGLYLSGDKLIQDFALAYSYNGEEIRNVKNKTTDPTNGADIKIGMVIEQVAKLDSAGSTKISDASYYADKYKSDIGIAYLAKIQTGLEAGGSSAQLKAQTGKTSINSKIGANVEGWGTLFGSEPGTSTVAMGFNSVINNFNRLQWYYTFTNTKTGDTIGENNNANFVYRAWAYIIVDGTATVSSTPSYFTLYDSASR